jgi:hypothetical protein
MPTSRFVRPREPAQRIVLTKRDLEVLRAISKYRILYARHLRELVFPRTSLRGVQRRLRLLWEHRFVERYYRPVLMTGERPETLVAAYGLGSSSSTVVLDGTPLGTPKSPSLVTFDHEIAAADVLCSITAACRTRMDLSLIEATPQGPLWSRIKATPASRPFLVPDGVIRLQYPDGATPAFYIEIVRADVRGGNDSIRRKMVAYLQLNREQRFRDLYGHDQLRAVLFLTTSLERAERFRTLATKLPHGRRLFWFGCYTATGESGRDLPGVTPENVLDARWRSTEGTTLSFLSP